MSEEQKAQERKVVRADLATRLFVVFVAVCLVASLGVLAVVTFRIYSCTTPGQSCYERGQSQTGQAVANINEVIILAAACSVDLPPGMSVVERQTRIQQCVITRLAADNAK